MNSRISTEYVSIESRRDHELLIVIFLEILQISIQFLILFGRHYGRNAQALPPSCPIFLPMFKTSFHKLPKPLMLVTPYLSGLTRSKRLYRAANLMTNFAFLVVTIQSQQPCCHKVFSMDTASTLSFGNHPLDARHKWNSADDLFAKCDRVVTKRRTSSY